MNTFFYNPGARQEMIKMYFQKLDHQLIRYELMKIETTYGDTDVLILGDKKLHPLVFLNDPNLRNSSSLDLVIELLNDFRIYTVNLSIRPDLSDDSCLSVNDDSYGKWMYEIMSRLGVRNVFLTGISLGGFVALKMLAFDETKIAKAFLVNPAGVVPERLSEIPLISKEEAEKIKTPLHFFTDENSRLSLRKIFPSLNETVSLKDSTHELSVHDTKKIAEIIRNNIGL